jgi:hypothetical protein
VRQERTQDAHPCTGRRGQATRAEVNVTLARTRSSLATAAKHAGRRGAPAGGCLRVSDPLRQLELTLELLRQTDWPEFHSPEPLPTNVIRFRALSAERERLVGVPQGSGGGMGTRKARSFSARAPQGVAWCPDGEYACVRSARSCAWQRSISAMHRSPR